ncbi:PREDICTED: uncharacterized protein LOC109221248 [Nicotiana attenuata]|uniref:uncharacterized protein LOC109221248 n=1 Tax=Nicotiana attenuata TaxID=49451 RepID=UPI000904C532|nr:PREDICTED: uncharacterized protein LOC109221248 [Nicotiana attenuata]
MVNHAELLDDFEFTKLIEVPAEGQSGGMVMMWNHEIVSVHNAVRRNQEIHATIEIWINRNNNNHNNTDFPININHIIQKAIEFTFLTEKGPNTCTKIPIQIKWNKPPKGWFKLNIDASFKNHNEKTGIGGIIRDTYGNWIVGFAKTTQATGSLHAEIKALMEGLKTTQEWGMFPLEIETDTTEVVHAPTEGDPRAHLQARE